MARSTLQLSLSTLFVLASVLFEAALSLTYCPTINEFCTYGCCTKNYSTSCCTAEIWYIIVGSVVGVLVVVGIIVTIIIVCICRRRRNAGAVYGNRPVGMTVVQTQQGGMVNTGAAQPGVIYPQAPYGTQYGQPYGQPYGAQYGTQCGPKYGVQHETQLPVQHEIVAAPPAENFSYNPPSYDCSADAGFVSPPSYDCSADAGHDNPGCDF